VWDFLLSILISLFLPDLAIFLGGVVGKRGEVRSDVGAISM